MATIFLGLAAFWQGSNALKLAKEANLTSRNAFRLQAEASLRPVVQRDETSVSVPMQGQILLNYTLENTGGSSARKLRTGRHISPTLQSDVQLTADSLDTYGMLLPHQKREATTLVPWSPMPDSFYIHSFVVYEYRLPVPQPHDSVITYIYAETSQFYLNGGGLVQLGAEELELHQPLKSCVSEFHHPTYAVTNIK